MYISYAQSNQILKRIRTFSFSQHKDQKDRYFQIHHPFPLHIYQRNLSIMTSNSLKFTPKVYYF